MSAVYKSQISIEGVNETFITLIPEVKSALKVGEFKPISLCKVIYKIVVKSLANRLKKLLPANISPQQSAFIPGRLIFDNLLISSKILHSLGSRVKEKATFMALKMYMSKAYDRIE